MDSVVQALYALRDPRYQAFQAKLIPTLDSRLILGVRTPALRTFARKMSNPEDFLRELPHTCYEENQLHGLLLSGMQDFDRLIAELDRFLPYVDNWATCDQIRPPIFKSHREALLPHIRRWLASPRVYTERFAIRILMDFYLDEGFTPEILALAAQPKGEDYYLKMGQAWFFATALAKQYDASRGYLDENLLPVWVHNKSIQKAIESYRVTPEHKAYLRTLRRSAE